MPLFEYRVTDEDAFDDSHIALLEYMGKGGWELISYSNIMESPKSPGHFIVRMVFKKTLESE